MELDEALDELYGLPPDEFVARRDELARRLREAGARDAADELVSRRRPTVAAWAVNQLPRRRADDLERLLEVADRVRDAQRRALSGRAGDLRTAMVDLRTVVNELTDAAVMLVEERGSSSGAHRDHVAATLHAAAVDDEVREAVARG